VKTLAEQMFSYGAYHQDWRNKATHFFGVPLVTFSLLLFLSWFRLIDSAIPVTAATIFCAGVFAYYLVLDWKVALLQAPFSLVLLWLADRTAVLPLSISCTVFAASFVGGWLIQLFGHYLEGTRPALTDNLLQIFNAPLYLAVEVLSYFGVRRSSQDKGAEETMGMSLEKFSR
jgi:uncharacterized membrane protein YGL010W